MFHDRSAERGDGTSEREALLRDFDETARLVRNFVVNRFGKKGADEIHRAAREQYEEIIPEIRWASGVRGRAMNGFLRITAQEIAVYKAVGRCGGTAPMAWEICHEALRSRMEGFPAWKRWLLRRFMFSGLVRRVVRRRERRGVQLRVGDFAVRYLASSGSDFDFGVDYVRCGNLELAKRLGAEKFAPYLCMSDIALSDALGWGLIRTQSLADGCSHCDFRFKSGGATRISSKTPEVQETIERIEARSES